MALPDDLIPYGAKMPPVSQLTEYSTDELVAHARELGYYPPPREYRDDISQYVERYSKLSPDAPEFAAEVERLYDPSASRRAAVGLARKSQREYQQRAALALNPNVVLLRLAEDDEATCDGCARLNGFEGTIEEQEQVGLPGSQECGQNCRCDLIPTDGQVGQTYLDFGVSGG